MADVSVELIPVESSRDLRRFIDLPWKIYNRATTRSGCRRCASPFATRSTRSTIRSIAPPTASSSSRCATARPVGRIAAIENRAHNEFHNDRVGFFGFFECNDDPEAAAALFAAAESWLRARGLDTMRGPMNPSTNHECGMLVGRLRLAPHDHDDVEPALLPHACSSHSDSRRPKICSAYFFPMQRRAGVRDARTLSDARRACVCAAAADRFATWICKHFRAGSRTLLGDLQLGLGNELGIFPDVAGQLHARGQGAEVHRDARSSPSWRKSMANQPAS